MIFLTPNTIAEFVCLLFSFIFLFNDKEKIWRMQILYLLIIVVVEVVGIYLRNVIQTSNTGLYNFFILIEFSLVSLTFFYIYRPFQIKVKWIFIWLSVFLTIYITELFKNNFKSFVSTTATVISIVFVFFSLYYFYLKLNNNTYERLTFSAPFWWVTGTLFFYFGSTTCNLFFDYLIQSKSLIRYTIFSILNIILYTFWSYAFLCRYLQRRSYS